MLRFTYTGGADERIPIEATHITVAVKVVTAGAFHWHPNIVEVIFRDDVEKIEERAFACCPNLRRVVMLGVKVVEKNAFECCKALTDVECGKLEIIRQKAFYYCKSLGSINLPSARIVERYAFGNCIVLKDVKFGSKLERIESFAFTFSAAFGHYSCLKRITIPLKDGIFTDDDNAFMGCDILTNVDLVEGAVLQETIAALNLEEWRHDMTEEIDSINRILPNAPAVGFQATEKTHVVRMWIGSVLHKIVHYKAEHRRVLGEAAAALQLVLPHDILMNNVLSFLELPAYSFEGEDETDDSDKEQD